MLNLNGSKASRFWPLADIKIRQVRHPATTCLKEVSKTFAFVEIRGSAGSVTMLSIIAKLLLGSEVLTPNNAQWFVLLS